MEIKLRNELRLFPSDTIELQEGLTFVAGCNGAGKSTLLREISSYCDKNKITNCYLDCSEKFTCSDAEQLPEYSAQVVILKGWRSEHEHYEDMFAEWVGAIRPPDSFRDKDFFVIIDGLDSGGDIVNFKKHINLFKLITKDAKERGIRMYLLVSCNNFFYLAYAKKGEVLFVPTFTTKKLPAYREEDFKWYVQDIQVSYKARCALDDDG